MTDEWPRQFEKSLRAGEVWPGSLDDYLGAITDDFANDEGGPVFVVAARVLLAQQYRVIRDVIETTSWGDSPIEIPMFFSLWIAANEEADEVIFHQGVLRPVPGLAPVVITIEPQAQIGDYRVDFLVTARARWGADSYADVRVVVECDGHQFHERTKEQARSDRRRDRELQKLGFLIYRYTGSEIWRDVYACAHEVITAAQAAALAEMTKRP